MYGYNNASAPAQGSISSHKKTGGNQIDTEEVREALLSYGNDVFCLVDAELNVSYLSDNWKALTGLAIEEGMGAGVKERIFPGHVEEVLNYLAGPDSASSAIRFQFKGAGDGWHWYELNLTEVRENKKAVSYKCLLSDVTQLVKVQDAYEQAKLEAEIANKSRSEFLANMNHELRTPLNAIIGFAQIMESGIYGDMGHPKYNDYINNIQSSGHTLLSKLSDLMEIANIDAGRMALDETQCDLVQIVHDAIELHAHGALTSHVELRENLPDYSIMVMADRVRILQVMTNIISNAIKHNRSGGTVDVYCEKRKGGGINVVVEDTGKGIPPAHLEDILSAFGQDNSFFARSRDCVGLGLALSKEIIKLHQGGLEIESKQGEGTVLKIVLPPARILKTTRARARIQNLSAAS